MGQCCSSSRNRRSRGGEREPLLPKYGLPPQDQFNKVAEILGALGAGKYPSQEQLNTFLRLLINSDMLKVDNIAVNGPLSQSGLTVLSDVRRILQALIRLGLEKNSDDRVQDLAWQLSLIDEIPITMSASLDYDVSIDLGANATELPNQIVSEEEIKQDIRRGTASIKTLVSLLVTSSAFRLILSDTLVLARDVVADIAFDIAKAAAVVEIKAEQLEAAIRPDEEESNGASGVEHIPDAHKGADGGFSDIIDDLAKESERRKQDVWDRVNEETPDRVKESIQTRIKQIIEQAQANPKYTASLATLLHLLRKYADMITTTILAVGETIEATTSNGGASVAFDPQIQADPHLSKSFSDIKVILERISGYGLDLLGTRFIDLLRDFGTEKDMTALLSAMENWTKRSLLQQGWIRTQEAQLELDRLYEWFQNILQRNSKYKRDFQRIVEELFMFRDALVQDRALQDLLDAFKAFSTDLESIGKLGLKLATVESSRRWRIAKQELRDDILSWVLPRILRALRVIPLPRVELKSDALDLVIDKITVTSPSFVPDHVQVTNHTDFHLRASDASSESYETSTTTRTRIFIDGLRISIEDIAYYVNAKGPLWLGWLDQGLLTVDIGSQGAVGQGLAMTVELEFPPSDADGQEDIFRVLDTKVDIPGLEFTFDHTRHWIFNSLVTQPLLGPLVRSIISYALSAQVKTALTSINDKLKLLKNKADAIHAIPNDPPSLDDYWSAFNQSVEPNIPPAEEPEIVSSEANTRVQTEATAKGIIRTTITETVEGDVESSVLAVGIGEQILPGLPDLEQVPSLAAQGREALDELDEARKGVKRKVETVEESMKDAQARVAKASQRMRNRARVEHTESDWRSHAFDL